MDGVHSLLVPRATADNSGEYVCEAYNEYGDTDTFCRLAVKGTASADSGEVGGGDVGGSGSSPIPFLPLDKTEKGKDDGELFLVIRLVQLDSVIKLVQLYSVIKLVQFYSACFRRGVRWQS